MSVSRFQQFWLDHYVPLWVAKCSISAIAVFERKKGASTLPKLRMTLASDPEKGRQHSLVRGHRWAHVDQSSSLSSSSTLTNELSKSWRSLPVKQVHRMEGGSHLPHYITER